MIPGNHDIKWTNKTRYSDDSPVVLAPAAATAPFRDFSSRFYGYEPNQHLSMARRLRVFPTGSVMDIIALNSSSLEQGKNFLAGMGRIQEAAYKEAATSLNWHQGSGLALRVLALHHHVALTEKILSLLLSTRPDLVSRSMLRELSGWLPVRASISRFMVISIDRSYGVPQSTNCPSIHKSDGLLGTSIS